MKLSKVYKRAKEYNAQLQADDPRFRRSVLLLHKEGTTLFFQRAFRMTAGDQYLVIFTEHHGFHVYHCDEVTKLFQFQGVTGDLKRDLFKDHDS